MTNHIKRIRPLKCRSVWLSDIHLGYRGCKAEFLLDFLRTVECDYIYLVGDIFDIWYLKRKGFYWPQSHNNVIRTILGKAKHNTRVIYIPGNHDEMFREYNGLKFGNVEIHNKYIHTTVDGRKLLMMHGDEFDSAVRCNRLIGFVGDVAYDALLYINRYLNIFRRKLGFPYWSLASFVKSRVKNAMNAVEKFEAAVSHEAHRAKVDGLVCGHIHHAQMREIGDILYCNDGDWVENCTTMIEHRDGSLELLRWHESITSLATIPARTSSSVKQRKIA